MYNVGGLPSEIGISSWQLLRVAPDVHGTDTSKAS